MSWQVYEELDAVVGNNDNIDPSLLWDRGSNHSANMSEFLNSDGGEAFENGLTHQETKSQSSSCNGRIRSKKITGAAAVEELRELMIKKWDDNKTLRQTEQKAIMKRWKRTEKRQNKIVKASMIAAIAMAHLTKMDDKEIGDLMDEDSESDESNEGNDEGLEKATTTPVKQIRMGLTSY